MEVGVVTPRRQSASEQRSLSILILLTPFAWRALLTKEMMSSVSGRFSLQPSRWVNSKLRWPIVGGGGGGLFLGALVALLFRTTVHPPSGGGVAAAAANMPPPAATVPVLCVGPHCFLNCLISTAKFMACVEPAYWTLDLLLKVHKNWNASLVAHDYS